MDSSATTTPFASSNAAAVIAGRSPPPARPSSTTPSSKSSWGHIQYIVLIVLCIQNVLYTVVRRYSLGILQEQYSKYEVLLVSEIIKYICSHAILKMTSTRIGFVPSSLVRTSSLSAHDDGGTIIVVGKNKQPNEPSLPVTVPSSSSSILGNHHQPQQPQPPDDGIHQNYHEDNKQVRILPSSFTNTLATSSSSTTTTTNDCTNNVYYSPLYVDERQEEIMETNSFVSTRGRVTAAAAAKVPATMPSTSSSYTSKGKNGNSSSGMNIINKSASVDTRTITKNKRKTKNSSSHYCCRHLHDVYRHSPSWWYWCYFFGDIPIPLPILPPMLIVATLYGIVNILSMIALRNIGIAMYSICIQCKIISTAICSMWFLRKSYTNVQWRALISLFLSVLLFTEPIWNQPSSNKDIPIYLQQQSQQQQQSLSSSHADRILGQRSTENNSTGTNTSINTMTTTTTISPTLGTIAVFMEVIVSGIVTIYYEYIIKMDQHITIWERNIQLAWYSFPVYIGFRFFYEPKYPIHHLHHYRDTNRSTNVSSTIVSLVYHPIIFFVQGLGHGWSFYTWLIALFQALGGILVALSIRYSDSVMKTLATTGAIVISAFLDYYLGESITPNMILSGCLVLLSICNYSMDPTTLHTVQTKTTTPSTELVRGIRN